MYVWIKSVISNINLVITISSFFFFFFSVVGFVIDWHESAMDLHVFPIPISPPTTLSTRSLWVFSVLQAWALVSCIQPGLVICFTIDNIQEASFLKLNSSLSFPVRSQNLPGPPRDADSHLWHLTGTQSCGRSPVGAPVTLEAGPTAPHTSASRGRWTQKEGHQRPLLAVLFYGNAHNPTEPAVSSSVPFTASPFELMTNLDSILKSRHITLPTKARLIKAMVFSSSQVMWDLDYKENWAPKNGYFWTVVLEKTLESPLDGKEIQLVHPKRNKSWIFIGRTDAEAETPILWLPDVKNWLIGKDPDAGKDWRQDDGEKGMAEDEMVGWHHRLDGHESE